MSDTKAQPKGTIGDDPRLADIDEQVRDETARHRARMRRLRGERATLAAAIEHERLAKENAELRKQLASLSKSSNVAAGTMTPGIVPQVPSPTGTA